MSSNQTEIEAGEWLARLDRDERTPSVLAEFDRWKAADPRRAAAYARLAATWQELDRIQIVRPRSDEPVDNDYLKGATRHPDESQESSQESLAQFSRGPSLYSVAGSPRDWVQDPPQYSFRDSTQQSAVHSPQPSLQHAVQETPKRRSRRRPSYVPWFFFSLAASILIAIAAFWIERTSGGPHTFGTSVGGFQRVVLADQSAIELNTDSEVRVALSPQMRKVELVRGEASFEVAHDASRPFIVSAGKTAVRAVGTKFNVHRLANSVEVIVDEGKVLVGAPEMLQAQEIVVSPPMLPLVAGQTAISSESGVKLTTLAKSSVARKLAWQNQMLVFDGDFLAEVIAQFNRYNERQLVITDPSVATIRIGGYFRPTNLDAFVSVLQSDFGIRVNPDGNRLVLAASTIK
jgi:transmembrane sensor